MPDVNIIIILVPDYMPSFKDLNFKLLLKHYC